MIWCRSYKADPMALALADRHYNRQKQGAVQFVPPGRSAVFLARSCNALWVTSWPQYAQHAWTGAWLCTMFRNEGAGVASELIREAVACTRWRLGPCGPMANIREAGWAPSENLRREDSSRANREDIAFHLSPTFPI